MTPLVPEVHAALVDAARRRARAPRCLRRPRRPRRAGLLALAAVLAGGSALAATTWHPRLGTAEPAATGVPAGQVAALAVLRRAQTDADRGPRVQAALRMLFKREMNGVHVDGVRRLAGFPGGALVLVPLQRVGSHDRGYPSTVRRNVLCVMTFVGWGSGVSCGTTADLRAGKIAGSAREGSLRTPRPASPGRPGSDTAFRFFQLVPDGVTRVDVTLRGNHTRRLAVHDNTVSLRLPGVGWLGNIRTRWLGADGRAVAKRR